MLSTCFKLHLLNFEFSPFLSEMACYAAVLSLFHTLENLKNHPRPPISLHQSHLHSLNQNITCFQHFLESYFTQQEHYPLETRITDAAHAAEDLIETRIVHHIHLTSDVGEKTGVVDLYEDLQKVIEHMDFIKEEVMEIIKHRIMRPHHPDLLTNSSLSPSSKWQSTTAPAFDDAMTNQVLEKLALQYSSTLRIISIVGMGGIGKTTFARHIFQKPLIVEYFDCLAWVTVSQEYTRGNLLQILCQEATGKKYSSSEMSEDKIGEYLYKHLYGRRYLIVIDDIWSDDAWYKIKSFFPNNNNGSRIMITTRLTNLALELSDSHVFEIQFLNDDESWDLFCKIVFDKKGCPIELENIGKQIAIKCKGLPLSLAVIGGLLKKSNMKLAYWVDTLENMNSLVNLENDEYVLRVLRKSYMELPIHLKPCFLYMGIFPEDEEIKMSTLIRLWVSEGILRPISGKSLEEVAKEYLKELISRNLLLYPKLRRHEKAKFCKIHDLVRDVCLVEAKKQKFFFVITPQKKHIPQDMTMERRIVIDHGKAESRISLKSRHAIESVSHVRSLFFVNHNFKYEASPSLHSMRLMRVYTSNKWVTSSPKNAVFEHANLRNLSLRLKFENSISRLNDLFFLVWNLQTLKVGMTHSINPISASGVWEMPLLRYVKFNQGPSVILPSPKKEATFVLENLHTMKGIVNFELSEEVIRRIPNIKTLSVSYDSIVHDKDGEPNFYLNNLSRLRNLKTLKLETWRNENIGSKMLRFPCSLKKLTLCGVRLSWETLTKKIGSLPLVQFLKLLCFYCTGNEQGENVWETNEGEFCRLRVLIIEFSDLKIWETQSSHFPRLEKLSLRGLTGLEEIPSSIGDIATLKSIMVDRCSKSAEDSAKIIIDEQEDYGNQDLQVEIIC